MVEHTQRAKETSEPKFLEANATDDDIGADSPLEPGHSVAIIKMPRVFSLPGAFSIPVVKCS